MFRDALLSWQQGGKALPDHLAIPNLIGVFLLSGTVVKLVKNYFSGDEYIPYHEQAKMLKGDK